MEKIIVEIKCPASSRSYEFRISKKLSVADGTAKIISEIHGFEHNENIPENAAQLFDAEGRLLNGSMTFLENGVKSGDSLMII